MDGRDIEPRKVLWAVAEITWEDDSGTSFRVPAVLEDTSRSGACVRLKRPVAVGSRIAIKWQREQFPAVARNCRRDGGDFLFSVRREAEIASAAKSASHRAIIDAKAEQAVENPADATHPIAAPAETAAPAPVHGAEATSAVVKPTPAPSRGQLPRSFQNAVAAVPRRPRTETHTQGTSPRPERTVMQPKNNLSAFLAP